MRSCLMEPLARSGGRQAGRQVHFGGGGSTHHAAWARPALGAPTYLPTYLGRDGGREPAYLGRYITYRLQAFR